jgi:hypothetical protein
MSDHLAKERKETDAIKREALRLGIDIRGNADWWWEDIDNFDGSVQDWELFHDDYIYLTEIGKVGARKLIRAELRRLEIEARKDIEWQRQKTQWKLTIAGIVIGWVLGVSGIIVAILALLNKSATH